MNREQQIAKHASDLRALLGVAPDRGDDRASGRDERILAEIVAGAYASTAASGRVSRRSAVVLRTAFAFVAVLAIACAAFFWQSDRTPAAATPPALRFSAVSIAELIDGAGSSASSSLSQIASAAAAIPPVTGEGSQRLRSYAWYLTTTVDSAGHSKIELAPTFQTTTLGPDGSFVNRETRGAALSVDGEVIDPDRFPVGGADSEDRFPAGTLNPSYPASLPRDPGKLYDVFIAAQGGDAVCLKSDLAEASCLYAAIVDLYTHWVVPPDLSAAVWQTFGRSDAVVDMGTTVDRLGRAGHAVALPPDPAGANQAVILVIDPARGQLLSWEQVSVSMPEAGVGGPVVSGFQAIADAMWLAP